MISITPSNCPSDFPCRSQDGACAAQFQRIRAIGNPRVSAQIHSMVDLIGILLDFLGTVFGEWINRRNGLRMIAIALVISYYSYKFYRLV
jgi:hypothetical protein